MPLRFLNSKGLPHCPPACHPVGDECFSPTFCSLSSVQGPVFHLPSHGWGSPQLQRPTLSNGLLSAVDTTLQNKPFVGSVGLRLFAALLWSCTAAPGATLTISSLFCQIENSNSWSLISPHLSRAQILNRANSLLQDLLSTFSGISGVLYKGLNTPFFFHVCFVSKW